jgi:hypothetical protein
MISASRTERPSPSGMTAPSMPAAPGIGVSVLVLLNPSPIAPQVRSMQPLGHARRERGLPGFADSPRLVPAFMDPADPNGSTS